MNKSSPRISYCYTEYRQEKEKWNEGDSNSSKDPWCDHLYKYFGQFEWDSWQGKMKRVLNNLYGRNTI